MPSHHSFLVFQKYFYGFFLAFNPKSQSLSTPFSSLLLTVSDTLWLGFSLHLYLSGNPLAWVVPKILIYPFFWNHVSLCCRIGHGSMSWTSLSRNISWSSQLWETHLNHDPGWQMHGYNLSFTGSWVFCFCFSLQKRLASYSSLRIFHLSLLLPSPTVSFCWLDPSKLLE